MASNFTRSPRDPILDLLIQETCNIKDEDILNATADYEGDPEAIAEGVRVRFAAMHRESEQHDNFMSGMNNANGGESGTVRYVQGREIFPQDLNLVDFLGSSRATKHELTVEATTEADITEDWLSIPFSLSKPIDLVFGRTALNAEGKVGELKIGRLISLSDNANDRGLGERGWKDVELRLILTLNADGQIDDVSVTARAASLGEEAFTLRLRDRKGKERALSLSRTCMQGYAVGAPLLGDVDELELLFRVQHFKT